MILSIIKRYFSSFIFSYILLGMLSFMYWPLGGLSFLAFWIFLGSGVSIIASVIIGTLWTVIFYPGLKIGVLVPLIVVRILVHLFIVTPLHFIGKSSSFIIGGLEASISNLTKQKPVDDKDEPVTRPKISYVVLFVIFLAGLTYIVGVDVSTFGSMMSQATILILPLVLIPLILTILVSGISLKLNGVSFGSAAPTNQERIDAVGQASNVAENAVGVYKDLDHINEKRKSIKKGAKTLKNGKHAERARQVGKAADEVVENTRGLRAISSNLSKLPKIGPWLEGLVGGTAGGTAILVLLVVLVIIIFLWLLVAAFFIFITGGIFYTIVFPFLGDVFGVAGAYGADIGGAVGSGPSADLETPSAVSNSLSLASARISCMLEGPACMQEWRHNNTQRPGSESVGQEFGLEIEDFNVNSGLTLDISTRRQSDTIPVQFDVYNPIQGLRGIEARDVQYRVAIDGGPTTNCVTDWRDLGGQFLGADDNAIAPGGFARPTGSLEDLTLKNCGALQPGYSQNMDAELQIKYNYSSQSTLQFEAMSEDYMIDQGIRPEPTQSQTANTPVMAYVNVQSPVVFRDEGNERQPITFPVWFGFETDRFDLEYRVQPRDFEIYSSSLLTDVDRASPSDYNIDISDNEFAGSCDDITHEGNTEYSFSSNYSDRIEDSQEDDNWYTRSLGPSNAECTMILDHESLDSISPTGESMSIRVDANYTVTLSSSSEDFEVTNNRCGRSGINCPMIVAESDSEDGLISPDCNTATDIQATDGCTVVENNDLWASGPEVINRNNRYSEDIENRERAYMIEELVESLSRDIPDDSLLEFEGYEEDGTGRYDSTAAVGLDERVVDNINDSRNGYAITSHGPSSDFMAEIELLDEYHLCSDQDGSDSQNAENLASGLTGSDVIYYSIPVVDCDRSLLELVGDQLSREAECISDMGSIESLMRASIGDLPDSCENHPIHQVRDSCEEGEVRAIWNDAEECISY